MLSDFVDAATTGFVQANGRWYFGAKVQAVDLEKNTLTIRDREVEKTFPVAKNALISVDGKQCNLADVPTGVVVNMGLAADQTTAFNIGCEGPNVGDCGGSPVKSVDTEKNTITFDDKARPEIAGKTFQIGKNANITIDGKPGRLSGIPPGSHVNLAMSVDGQFALRVNAQGPPVDCDCGGSMVKSVNVEKRTITFDDKARGSVAGKTFNVAPDANIIVDGGPGTLAQAAAGTYVSLTLLVDQVTVGTVRAQGPGVSGVVKAVHADAMTVTLGDKTYPVAKGAIIVVDGKQTTLAGLAAGRNVNINVRVDLKTVGMIQTISQ
jgi:hypothetical protein